jgi:UPF0755 protein
MFRKVLKGFVLAAVVLLLAAAALFWREYRRPAGGPGGKALIEIEPGQTVRTIALNLEKSGIIRRSWVFLAGYRVFHNGRKLKAGEYEIPPSLGARDVLGILIEGKVFLHSVTIPEGLTIPEIDEILRKEAFPLKGSFLKACGNPSSVASFDPEAASPEGYLFPETYLLPKGTPAETLVESMTARFREIFGETGFRKAAALRMSVRSVVTLASLIEKETSLAEEKPLVSAVFHHRLRIGMKLDCDPTVIYALKRDGLYRGRILLKDLKYESPYNTYVAPGLPPGPICNPGRDSLLAALNPAPGDYLYFVADNKGGHRFSRTYGEHLRAVKKYRNSI